VDGFGGGFFLSLSSRPIPSLRVRLLAFKKVGLSRRPRGLKVARARFVAADMIAATDVPGLAGAVPVRLLWVFDEGQVRMWRWGCIGGGGVEGHQCALRVQRDKELGEMAWLVCLMSTSRFGPRMAH